MMLVSQLCLLLIAVLLCRDGTQGLPFTITEQGWDGFTISLNGDVLFSHTRSSPMLFVGQGETAFPTSSGNFYITDYTIERLGLSDYNVSCGIAKCVIYLSRDKHFVNLTLTSVSADQPMVLDVSTSDTFDRLWLRIVAELNEQIYGGGEQYSYLNLRHRDGTGQNKFPIWTSEQGVGRNKSTEITFIADTQFGKAGGDYFTTYFPQPTFVSSRRYYFHYHGSNYAILDFGHDNFHEVFILGRPGRVSIGTGKDLLSVVKSISTLLGRMPPLPEWTQSGAILAVQGGTQRMLDMYRLAKQNRIPVSGIWIQDWCGKQDTPFGKRVNWNWKWDPSWYPGLDTVIQDLKKEGVRILGYINPYLDHRSPLFAEAASKEYFVKNSTGGIYYTNSLSFIIATIDLTNPEAFEWYKNEIVKKNMIQLGLGGWMADFGEYLPVDVVVAGGQAGRELHNAWPVQWAKLNRQAVEESGQMGEILFFSRAGFSGESNYTMLMFAGDQNVDFSYADGLHSAVISELSLGISGTGFSHHDIGGYTTFGTLGLSRTKELLLRSGEVAAFTAVFRTHEGNQPEYNEQWYSDDVLQPFSRLARIFAALKDYRIYVVNITSTEGIPVQRALALEFDGLLAPPTQYMFGPDILVCPVYLSNITQQTVQLPPSPAGWIHFWTLGKYTGDQSVAVSCPVGYPPVFYRSDSKFKDVFEKIKDISEMPSVPTVDPNIG